MKVATLGTILPNAKSLSINAEYARNLQNDKERIAEKLNGKRVVVSGEVRYYLDANFYQVVNSNLRVAKFEVRKDGDYFVCFVA